MKKSTLLKKVCALLFIVFAVNSIALAQTNVVITTTGTWTVPANVFSVVVGCWGGGGGGGGAYTGACSSASGGGGGAFSTQTLAVSPGQVYNVTIGAGGTAGSITGTNGGAGGTTTFTGTGGTCSATGGSGGISSTSSDFGDVKPGVSGGNGGTGFLYAGGNSGASYHGSWSGSSGGGGGAGNGGAGGNSPGGSNAAGGVGGIGTYPGGAGAAGWCCSINNKAGVAGNAPGGGGSGGTTGSCSSDAGHIGGVGGKGQVLLTYTACGVAAVTVTGAGTFCGFATLTATGGTGGTIYFQGTTSGGTSTATPGASASVSTSGTYYFRASDGSCWGPEGSVTVTVTPGPCTHWLNQFCPLLPTGSYIDGGTFAPVVTLKNISTSANTGGYGYIYWTFTAAKDTTYYFDLCSSTGTSGSSWLRLHNARNTSPSNNYCMDAGNTPTLILENIANGCTGTGVGLSKLIWTCQASGTYYLETAVNVSPTFWGYSGNQTATLNYKTLSSSTKACTDVFYDKGIDGSDGPSSNYNNNEDWIYTYYPVDTVADAINVQFVSFSTSPGDQLCVFNGNSINAPIIGCYSGPSITGAFSSSANDGSLTFHFTSDNTGTSTGWNANVSCVASLHVNNNAPAMNIVLYPNPAKDELTISHQSTIIDRIEIYDILGKSVRSLQSEVANQKSDIKIDVSTLPAGIYFIQANGGASKWNGKFIKQ